MGFYSQHIGKLKPKTMMAHHDYIKREGKYGKRKDLIYTESGHLPNWAADERDYWKTIQEKESELEGQVAEGKKKQPNYAVRKLIFALPNEMSDEEMIQFTKDYLEENFKDLPYTFALHKKDSAIYGISNPHVHLIFSDYVDNERNRNLDKDTYFKKHGISKKGKEYGGAYRTRDFTALNSAAYRQARKNLADRINAWYKERGIDKSVSEKSIEDQMKEAMEAGDYISAETLRRKKPFRLNPQKFKEYQKVIQQKIRLGWRNVENLDDIPDPEVRERIAQEFEKQLKEELMKFKKYAEREPSNKDKMRALDHKIQELQLLMSYAPGRSVSRGRNQKKIAELEKEKTWISLRMKEEEPENFYLEKKEENSLTQKYQVEEIKRLKELTDQEKIKEYAEAQYIISAMRKRMADLRKETLTKMFLDELKKKKNAKAEELEKKLDSRQSLRAYLDRKGDDLTSIDNQIEEIQKAIQAQADISLTEEEKKEIHNRYYKNQEEIHTLRNLSTRYAERIQKAGLRSQDFIQDHKKEIVDYFKSLKRLDDYEITPEKETPEEEKIPSRNKSRQEILDDTVLKRIDHFKTLMETETWKTWKGALREAAHGRTSGALQKLEKEKKFLEEKAQKEMDYQKVKEYQKRLKAVKEEIRKVEETENRKIEKDAAKILKKWRKDRKAKIDELKDLQQKLIKDAGRKYVNPKIKKLAKDILKGSNLKIDRLSIRTTHSRYEEDRLAALDKGYRKRDAEYLKQYNDLIPHTPRYYLEKMVDQKSGGEISRLKKEIRENKKARDEAELKGEDLRLFKDQEEKLKEAINGTITDYETPEMRVEANEKSKESWKHWPENRKLLRPIFEKYKRHLRGKRMNLKERQRREHIIQYTGYRVSRHKLVEEQVTKRMYDFKDKVLKTIPRKEEFYRDQIIDEITGGALQKRKDLAKEAEKVLRDIEKKYPKGSTEVKRAEAESLAKKKEIENFTKAHTTAKVEEEAKRRQKAAKENLHANMDALKKESYALIHDISRKHLDGTTRKQLKEMKDNLDTIIYETEEREEKQKAWEEERAKAKKGGRTNLQGAKDLANDAEDLVTGSFHRANIHIPRKGMEY